MAERRMFAKTIIDSDIFLDMPLSTQALYFHLSMRADDDGFINNPKKIQRMVGASDDDLKLLVAKQFIIPFETGIVVIKHWKIHNYIQKDRYKETLCTGEKKRIAVQPNNEYTLASEMYPACIQHVSNTDTACIQNGYNMDTQVRLGKVRIVKDSLGEDSAEISGEESPTTKTKQKRFSPPTVEDVQAYCRERGNKVDAQRFYDYYTANGWKVGKNAMKDWRAAVRTWERSSYGTQPRKAAAGTPLQEYTDEMPW